jgi:hypothetical protein
VLVPFYAWDKGQAQARTWTAQYLGDWQRPTYFFFNAADIARIMNMYDDALYLRLNETRPWLQLFLPFPIYRFLDDPNFDSEKALDDLIMEFNRLRESIGLEPKYRFRPEPRASLFAPIDDC